MDVETKQAPGHMRFEMVMTQYPKGLPEVFSEDSAPDWLTSVNTVKGSTMDMRWFWKDHVLTLGVGETVQTEFRTIKRIS